MAPKKRSFLDPGAAEKKQALARRSNRLLDALRHLRDTERRKREVPISTPTFHELANEVNTTSREIFRLAHEQERLGDEVPRGAESIEDVDPSDGSDRARLD